MTADLALHMLSELLWACVMIAAPVLAVTMIVGLVVSVLQVVTQVQEMTLTFVPKMLAAAIALVAFGAWMLRTIAVYWTRLWASIPSLSQ